MYELAVKSQFLNWVFLLIIAFGVVSWATKFPLNLKPSPWLYIPIGLLGLLSFLAWILVWGWYSVWFRYLAYGVARVISGIRGILSSTIIQLVIILGLSAGFWVWRKSFYPKENASAGACIEFWREILQLDSLLKILVIAAALFTLWKLFQSRGRIVICDFVNFTNKKDELDPVVKGLASICANEMSRLRKLLKTYEDIHPDATKGMAKAELNLDVGDIGNDFEQIIGPDSSIKIGNVITVPIRALYGFFRKILHGPMLTGGVHLKGENFILTASLKVGKFKGNWQISFEEDETPPKSESEKLNKLTERLVCRILTDLSQGITPRWKAMHNFIEGLQFFRETLRTEEKRKLYLIKAKDAFSKAVRDDEQFVQCYYNFGYIYRKLKSDEAAKAAFREALERNPDYHQCCYQLAHIYYEYYINESDKGEKGYKCLKENSLFDAQWFCQQAIFIRPTDPTYWNLMAVIQYYKWWNEEEKNGNKEKLYDYKEKLNVPDEVIRSSIIGTMLAWRALCKAIIKDENIQEFKKTAQLCTRNLAVITGENKFWRSRLYFGQAAFLDLDNNDLYFEAGKYFFRRNKKSCIKKANKAFKRVFEDDADVNDPFSYWAFYMNVNAKLYEEKKEKEYLDVVKNGYIHFLDAAAEIIHNKKPCDEIIKQNEQLVICALSPSLLDEINKNYPKKGIISKIYDILNAKNDNGYIIDINCRKLRNKDIRNYCPKELKTRFNWPYIFLNWIRAQISIEGAILILNEVGEALEKPKQTIEKLEKAEIQLKHAIKRLEKCYHNELKILGLHKYLAAAYYLMGSHEEEALKVAREAARLNPYDPEVREVLGKVYFNLKDYRQAIKELQICFHLDKPEMDILQKKNILEKIGEAYIAEGHILRDPARRIESFNNAAKFFKECHDIIEDKSYDVDTQEYESYIETLGKTHFNLGYFYRELLRYDDAISHYQSALEMAKALKSNVDILETMLRMGWVYLEIQSFAEAEKNFKEAGSYQGAPSLTSTEIAIGLMFLKVERAISFDKNAPFEETVQDRTVITKESLEVMANEDRREIDQSSLNDAQKKEKTQEIENKKNRLLALHHECLGRLNWKQGEMDEAAKQFEKSISFMPNPRVYLYLAEFYLREISDSRIGRKEALMAKARNACKLCRKNDLRLQYKQDVDDLEKKLEAREK